jgi:hypothetical protein
LIGKDGLTGATGPQGIGIPNGGLQGQFLIKASNCDYDTKWVSSNEEYDTSYIINSKVESLSQLVRELMDKVKLLDSRYCMLVNSNDCSFDGTLSTHASLLFSYLNVMLIFDCGDSNTDFSLGPALDCGEYFENYVGDILLAFDAGDAEIYDTFNIVEETECDVDLRHMIFLDGGTSVEFYNGEAVIDCGNSSNYIPLCIEDLRYFNC